MSTPAPCQCSAPNAACRRAGKPMLGRLWELCSGTNCSAELSYRYRCLWDKLPVPTRTIQEPPAAPKISVGPGGQLSRLLSRFGITYTPGCKCRSMAAKMDALGCEWCESDAGVGEILEAMRTEAARRALPFLDAVGKLLVRRAIKAARKEAARGTEATGREGGNQAAV